MNTCIKFSILVAVLNCQTSADSDVEDPKYSAGLTVLSVWQKEATRPRYGECWTNALNSLEESCKQLTEDTQHRLTLSFTNCFLQKTGRQRHHCDSHLSVQQCIGSLGAESYGVYAEFFAHTQSVCFYLEAEARQVQSELIMMRLANNSAVVSERMKNASSLQAELLRRQNETITHQQTILETGLELKRTIEESKMDVSLMMKDFKTTTSEHKDLIFGLFNSIQSLQNLVHDEFTGIYSTVSYVCAVVIVYILTTTPRTAGARAWLFLIIICCGLTESAVTFCMRDREAGDERAVMQAVIRWVRRFYVLLALVVYSIVAYYYQDYNVINNQLLLDIRRQIQMQYTELKSFIPVGQVSSQLSMVASSVTPAGSRRHEALEYSTSRWSGSSDDSDYDYDSDVTFRGSVLDNSFDSDVSGYSMVSRTSRGVTPMLLEELRDLRQATPLREMEKSQQHVQSLIGVWNKRTEKSSDRASTGSTDNSIAVSVSTTHSYNLRVRSNNNSPVINPVLQRESPRSFARQLKVALRPAPHDPKSPSSRAGSRPKDD